MSDGITMICPHGYAADDAHSPGKGCPQCSPGAARVVDPRYVYTIEAPAQPKSLSFHGVDTFALFTIMADGQIVRGPAFTTEDEMSLRFWEMIEQAYPKFLGRKPDPNAT